MNVKKKTPTRAERRTVRTPPRLRFKDSSWRTVSGLMALEIEGFEYSICFRHTTAIEDTPDSLVLDVDSPQTLSRVSRHHATLIYDTLSQVGRPKTVVRLRANLAMRSEEPDYLYRALLRPRHRLTQGRDVEESSTATN